MAYGTAKIDIVTFTNGGVDQDVSISGIVASTSGNLSVTGTVSGTTFTGVFGQFNTLTAVSGVFTSQISGSTVTGDTGQFITATGTTSSFTSGNFINLSGAVSTVTSGVFASGTASNPSISFSSDPDTGIYRPAADSIGFVTNGQAKLVIDVDGQLEATATGSQSLPTYTFSTDSDTGIYSPGANQLALSTGGAGRLFVDSSGNVGIGTSSPGASLDVNGGVWARSQFISWSGTTRGGDIGTTAAGRLTIRSYNATGADKGEIIFVRNNTVGDFESARIDSSGRLLVGTSSYSSTRPPGVIHLDNTSASTGSGNISLGTNGTSATNQNVLSFYRTRGTSAGAVDIVLNNDSLGAINFCGADGVDALTVAARIAAFVDGTPGADDMPGRLVFSTTADGSATPTERMRINSSGNVGIGSGNFSPVNRLHVRQDANSAIDHIYVQNRFALNSQARIAFSNGSTDYADGKYAYIGALISGVNQTGNLLVFGTNANNAAPTERMRITQSGNTLFGCTATPSASVAGAGFIRESSGRSVLITSTSSTASNALIAFFNPNGLIGGIATDGSATFYNTSSDYRLKENVVPLTGAIDRIQQIPVHRFNFIADPDKTVDGFIAHEAQAVVPECVTGEKDAIDDEGNPAYQGIDPSKLVPLLTAALQEAIAKIETLEAKVAALEVA